jgi:hypothetical protein
MEKRFKLVGEMDLWYISWTDVPLSPERITEMKRVQVNILHIIKEIFMRFNFLTNFAEFGWFQQSSYTENKSLSQYVRNLQVFTFTFTI